MGTIVQGEEYFRLKHQSDVAGATSNRSWPTTTTPRRCSSDRRQRCGSTFSWRRPRCLKRAFASFPSRRSPARRKEASCATVGVERDSDVRTGCRTVIELIKLSMEFFSRWRWRLYRPKVVSCCVYDKPPKMYATHALHHFMHVWLLGRSICSSPCTKELHELSKKSCRTPWSRSV